MLTHLALDRRYQQVQMRRASEPGQNVDNIVQQIVRASHPVTAQYFNVAHPCIPTQSNDSPLTL